MGSLLSLLNNRNLPKVALILSQIQVISLTLTMQIEIEIKNVCHFVYGILMD